MKPTRPTRCEFCTHEKHHGHAHYAAPATHLVKWPPMFRHLPDVRQSRVCRDHAVEIRSYARITGTRIPTYPIRGRR